MAGSTPPPEHLRFLDTYFFLVEPCIRIEGIQARPKKKRYKQEVVYEYEGIRVLGKRGGSL